MSETVLQLGAFLICDADASPQLREQLLALDQWRTTELVVDGLRGWWERQGGHHAEFAVMAPSLRTRRALDARADTISHRPRIARPNDAEDPQAFFSPLPRYVSASSAERAEARRRLLALAGMGWRSTSRWYGDRGELYER